MKENMFAIIKITLRFPKLSKLSIYYFIIPNTVLISHAVPNFFINLKSFYNMTVKRNFRALLNFGFVTDMLSESVILFIH